MYFVFSPCISFFPSLSVRNAKVLVFSIIVLSFFPPSYDFFYLPRGISEYIDISFFFPLVGIHQVTNDGSFSSIVSGSS